MPTILLPGNWSHIAPNVGLNVISSTDFDGRLYHISKVKAEGVPSIFAHPYAFAKALSINPPSPQTMTQFSVLIRALFLGIVDIEAKSLSVDNRLARVLQSFNAGSSFYLLKWQGKTIGGIYPDCFVFPGAKFVVASEYEARQLRDGAHPEPEYSGITLHSLEEEIDRQTRLYGPDLVKALFAGWVNEISAILALPAGAIWPVWFQRLNDVKNSVWPTTLVAPDGSLDKFTPISCNMQLSGGNIPLRPLTQRIFCEKVIYFKSSGEVPHIPVNSNYLHLIDIPATTYNIGDGNVISYSVQLKGWGEPIRWSPIELATGEFKASVLLWPNFKAAGWKLNYALFVPSHVFAGQNPKLRLIDNEFNEIKIISESKGCVTDRPVEYIEVLVNGKPAGIFKDNRPEIGLGSANVVISLDFGTTHTSLGVIQAAARNRYQLFNFQDMTHDILRMNYFKADKDSEKLRKGCHWLSPSGNDGRLTCLPSELVFANPDLLPMGDPALACPIENFSIPHPQIERDNLSKIIVANFKWSANNPFTQDRLIKAYLKMVLHMALSVIRCNHLCTNVSIVPAYPLAFGKNKYSDYKQILAGPDGRGGIFAELFAETGVTLNLAIVNPKTGLKELVAESYAAKAFWFPASGTAELVVDIGGGTTDIALWVNGNEYVDSFKYGANKYLEYLAKAIADFPTGINTAKERTVILQKKMRKEGIRGILGIYSQNQKTTAQEAIDRFFQGLFEYLYRLLSAKQVKKVNLHAVGNGWRLVEGYFPPNDSIHNYVKECFKNKNMDFTVILPHGGDYKGVVCRGATKIVDVGGYFPPHLDVPVKTILGGTIKVGGSFQFQGTKIPTGPLGTSPLGFDTTPFINSLPFPLPPCVDKNTICGTLNDACQQALYSCPGPSRQVGLNKSIFAIFLEKIYPEFYF